jgi:DNA-binding CsgD family transcriptional regulator
MQSDLPLLSLEEALILLDLGGGLTNEEISSIHGLDIETVRSRSRAVISKLHARSRAEFMRAAWDSIERATLDKAAPRGESAPSGLRQPVRESGEIDAAITRIVSRRFWVTACLAFASGVFSVITPMRPDWIEWVFGFNPDNRNGFVEWAIVLCLVTTTAILSFVAGHEWRRISHSWQS